MLGGGGTTNFTPFFLGRIFFAIQICYKKGTIVKYLNFESGRSLPFQFASLERNKTQMSTYEYIVTKDDE